MIIFSFARIRWISVSLFSQLQKVKYDCNKYGAILGPFFQNSYSEVKVGSCPKCQSKGPYTPRKPWNCAYRSASKIQGSDTVEWFDWLCTPWGRNWGHWHYANNFDLSLNKKNGFPVFSSVIEANYVTKKQDLFSVYKLTQENKEEIEKLSEDPRIGERIIKSIAPSIYGHEGLKTALALAMFGGQEKNVEGKHRLRGDINVFLLDSGTKKNLISKVCWKDWIEGRVYYW